MPDDVTPSAPATPDVPTSPAMEEEFISDGLPESLVLPGDENLTEIVPGGPDVTPAEPADDAATDDSWKTSLSTQYGVDVSQFESREQAEQALNQWASQLVSAPPASPPPASPPPASPAVPETQESTFDFDALKELDPKLSEAFKFLQSENKRLATEVQETKKSSQSVSKQLQDAEGMQTYHAFESVISGINHDRYGVQGRRNPFQTMATKNVASIVGQIKDHFGGDIEMATQWAMALDLGSFGTATPATPEKLTKSAPSKPFTPQPASPATASTPTPKSSRANSQSVGGGLMGNKEYMDGALAILNR